MERSYLLEHQEAGIGKVIQCKCFVHKIKYETFISYMYGRTKFYYCMFKFKAFDESFRSTNAANQAESDKVIVK